jgi:hypothetical protein
MHKREYGHSARYGMERAMTTTFWSESDVGRVVLISGATAAIMVALLLGRPFYSGMAYGKPPSNAGVSRAVAGYDSASETVSLVASPVIETNPQFFFGSGDGSAGYYAEQPELTLALVRYARMP